MPTLYTRNSTVDIKSHIEPFNLKHDRLNVFAIKIIEDKDEYKIYMGNDLWRCYDTNSLPDFLKSAIAMINSVVTAQHEADTGYEWEPETVRIALATYECPENYPSICKSIGWKFKNQYIIVMDKQQFRSLRE